VGEVVVPCFGNGTVNDPGDPEGVESTGNDPEISQSAPSEPKELN